MSSSDRVGNSGLAEDEDEEKEWEDILISESINDMYRMYGLRLEGGCKNDR